VRPSSSAAGSHGGTRITGRDASTVPRTENLWLDNDDQKRKQSFDWRSCGVGGIPWLIHYSIEAFWYFPKVEIKETKQDDRVQATDIRVQMTAEINPPAADR